MASLIGSPLAVKHVPAWKRLGLKLKYAREDVPSPVLDHNPQQPPVLPASTNGDDHKHAVEQATSSRKRKLSEDLSNDSQSPLSGDVASTPPPTARKAAKLSVEIPITEERPPVESEEVYDKGTESSLSRDGSSDSTTQSTHEKSKSRRKSVTFTPETKQEDGFSASTLFNKWSSELKAQQSQQPPSSKQIDDKERKPKAGKVKTQSPASKTSIEPRSGISGSGPAFVTYLELFHNDRPSWKFNKKKQNDLLKNLFDIDKLPAEHNEALLQYIRGLSGSSACQRVVDSAEAVLKEIFEKYGDKDEAHDMEADEARRAAYRDALRRQLEVSARAGWPQSEYDDEQLEELRRERERGERAEAVLGEALERYLHPERFQAEPSSQSGTTHSQSEEGQTAEAPSNQSKSSDNGNAAPKRKSRKSRTQDVAQDSESEQDAGFVERKDTPGTSLDARTELNVAVKPTGKKKIFDDDLLDKMFPKSKR